MKSSWRNLNKTVSERAMHLEEKRKAALSSLTQEQVEAITEVLQLDELSSRTLGSYATKAAKDFEDRKKNLGADGQLKKAQKRKKGVGQALDRMYGKQ